MDYGKTKAEPYIIVDTSAKKKKLPAIFSNPTTKPTGSEAIRTILLVESTDIFN
ncbi:15185_t:CDS:1, partial [Dentiscutata heterogama]